MLCCAFACINGMTGTIYELIYVTPAVRTDAIHPSYAGLDSADRYCIFIGKYGPTNYVFVKLFSYLFFFVKQRTVRPMQTKMGLLEKLVLVQTTSMLGFAAVLLWILQGDYSPLDHTCVPFIPVWMIILMCIADASLSTLYLYLFISPLRDTIQRNRAYLNRTKSRSNNNNHNNNNQQQQLPGDKAAGGTAKVADGGAVTTSSQIKEQSFRAGGSMAGENYIEGDAEVDCETMPDVEAGTGMAGGTNVGVGAGSMVPLSPKHQLAKNRGSAEEHKSSGNLNTHPNSTATGTATATGTGAGASNPPTRSNTHKKSSNGPSSALEQLMRRNTYGCICSVCSAVLSLSIMLIAHVTDDPYLRKLTVLFANVDIVVTISAIQHVIMNKKKNTPNNNTNTNTGKGASGSGHSGSQLRKQTGQAAAAGAQKIHVRAISVDGKSQRSERSLQFIPEPSHSHATPDPNHVGKRTLTGSRLAQHGARTVQGSPATTVDGEDVRASPEGWVTMQTIMDRSGGTVTTLGAGTGTGATSKTGSSTGSSSAWSAPILPLHIQHVTLPVDDKQVKQKENEKKETENGNDQPRNGNGHVGVDGGPLLSPVGSPSLPMRPPTRSYEQDDGMQLTDLSLPGSCSHPNER